MTTANFDPRFFVTFDVNRKRQPKPAGKKPTKMNTNVQKKYHLRVYDNFHYMNESEAYDHGQYDTYEEALVAAKAIVDEFFEHNWKPGISLDYLLKQYALYGDDPIIVPDEQGQHGRFSARTYSISKAAEICRKFENK